MGPVKQLLYLDIDGVLNRHERHSNGYSGLHPYPVGLMNRLLAAMPNVQLVLSSAWRYQLHNGNMTMAGIETLLLTHGLDCYQRIHSVTASDEDATEGQFQGSRTAPEYWEWLKQHGTRVRAEQIGAHLQAFRRQPSMDGVPVAFAIVDDLEVPAPRLVRTDPNVGLDVQHVQQLAELLTKPVTLKEVRAWWAKE